MLSKKGALNNQNVLRATKSWILGHDESYGAITIMILKAIVPIALIIMTFQKMNFMLKDQS
jgi:hypothetical protein